MQTKLLALVALAACKSAPAPAAPPPASVTSAAPPTAAASITADREPAAGQVLASDPKFRIELDAPATCADGCRPKLVVTTLGGYHVNAEYPTKFVPADGVTATGTFAVTDETTGVMTLDVPAGTPKVAGTLKLAVCTDEICEIEAPQIAFTLPR